MTAADAGRGARRRRVQRADPLRQQPHQPERRRGERAVVSVRAVLGKRVGRRVDQPPRRRVAARGLRRRRRAPRASRPRTRRSRACPAPTPVETPDRACRGDPRLRRRGPRRGRRRHRRAVASTAGLTAAGKVRAAEHIDRRRQLARRRRRAWRSPARRRPCSRWAPDGGSGWASLPRRRRRASSRPRRSARSAADLARALGQPRRARSRRLHGRARARGGRRHHRLPRLRGLLGQGGRRGPLVHERTSSARRS